PVIETDPVVCATVIVPAPVELTFCPTVKEPVVALGNDIVPPEFRILPVIKIVPVVLVEVIVPAELTISPPIVKAADVADGKLIVPDPEFSIFPVILTAACVVKKKLILELDSLFTLPSIVTVLLLARTAPSTITFPDASLEFVISPTILKSSLPNLSTPPVVPVALILVP